MTQNELDKILKAHKRWLSDKKGGWQADLQGANFRGADLRGANIDYSCWPLWCGNLDVKIDRRIFCQLAYYLCRVIVDDDDCKEAQLMLGRLANEFHRADECGRVPEPPKEGNDENDADRGYHYCSHCKRHAINYSDGGAITEVLSPYCPNCGAKMGAEETKWH